MKKIRELIGKKKYEDPGHLTRAKVSMRLSQACLLLLEVEEAVEKYGPFVCPHTTFQAVEDLANQIELLKDKIAKHKLPVSQDEINNSFNSYTRMKADTAEENLERYRTHKSAKK